MSPYDDFGYIPEPGRDEVEDKHETEAWEKAKRANDQELKVLHKLQDAKDGGMPVSEIAVYPEFATEVEQALRRLVSRGLVSTAVEGSPIRQGAQVSPLYWLSEKGRATLERWHRK
jgi:hypothetical protein